MCYKVCVLLQRLLLVEEVENCLRQQETEYGGNFFIYLFILTRRQLKVTLLHFGLALCFPVAKKLMCDISCISLPPFASLVILAISSAREFFVKFTTCWLGTQF